MTHDNHNDQTTFLTLPLQNKLHHTCDDDQSFGDLKMITSVGHKVLIAMIGGLLCDVLFIYIQLGI